MADSNTLRLNRSLLDVIWHESQEELLGRHNPFADSGYSEFMHAILDQYGELTGRGLARQLGQIAFHKTLKYAGDSIGLTTNQYRLQPMPQKSMLGLTLLSTQVESLLRHPVEVTATASLCTIYMEKCRPPTSDFILGYLQEFAAWVGSGKNYPIQMSTLNPDQCAFEVSLTAIE